MRPGGQVGQSITGTDAWDGVSGTEECDAPNLYIRFMTSEGGGAIQRGTLGVFGGLPTLLTLRLLYYRTPHFAPSGVLSYLTVAGPEIGPHFSCKSRSFLSFVNVCRRPRSLLQVRGEVVSSAISLLESIGSRQNLCRLRSAIRLYADLHGTLLSTSQAMFCNPCSLDVGSRGRPSDIQSYSTTQPARSQPAPPPRVKGQQLDRAYRFASGRFRSLNFRLNV